MGAIIITEGDAMPAVDTPTRSGDIRCPHCRSWGQRRSSREVTGQHRDIFYQCRNTMCGHTWKASLSYDYGLSPSAIPDPAVTLPLRPMPREVVMALLHKPPAPDPDQPGLFDDSEHSPREDSG